MPQSKLRRGRRKPQQHQAGSNHPSVKKSNRAILVPIIFFAFLGLGIGYFINPDSIAIIIASGLLGAAAGFIFGRFIKSSFSKNKE